MPEPTTPPAAPEAAELTPKAPEAGATPGDGDEAALGDAGKRALKAERERATQAEKAAADLQKQLDDINKASLSELERAQADAAAAQAQAQAASTEALRYRIAAETGITENVELILTAPDEETMRRQAQLWGSRAPTAPPAGPRPDLSQGGSGAPGTTPDQAAAEWLRGLTSSR